MFARRCDLVERSFVQLESRVVSSNERTIGSVHLSKSKDAFCVTLTDVIVMKVTRGGRTMSIFEESFCLALWLAADKCGIDTFAAGIMQIQCKWSPGTLVLSHATVPWMWSYNINSPCLHLQPIAFV